ncbi:Amino acid--[acyl-carrier-protein] ligase [compost metagenome]
MEQIDMITGYHLAEQQFDKCLVTLNCFHGAEEVTLSPILSMDFPLAKEYFESFPQHASCTNNDQDELILGDHYQEKEEARELLSPTCCYPLFKFAQEKKFLESKLYTVKNLCFRKEKIYEDWRRERSFRMREYIQFSTMSKTELWISQVIAEVKVFFDEMGFTVSVENASDPFFSTKSLKGKLQRQQELKKEFVVDGLAIASINFHLNSFCKKCEIMVDDQVGYSSCFGLGYHRFWYILTQKYGIDLSIKLLEEYINRKTKNRNRGELIDV